MDRTDFGAALLGLSAALRLLVVPSGVWLELKVA
jgi:hypothetical protein